MDHTGEDVCFITEETFDFGIDSPSDSRELCDSIMAEEEEVFVGPVRHVERCVAKSIDLNVQGARESQRAGGWGSKAGGDGGLLNWSPLSAEKLEEISREANRLASQLERTVLKENAGDRCQESPRVRALRDRQEPRRSPRRETYIVKDSPVKSLLPSVVPESGCPSPRPDAEGKTPAAKRRSRRTPGRAARTAPAQTVASPGPGVLPRCEGGSPAMSVPSSSCSLQPTSPSVPSPTQQAKRHSTRSPAFIRLPAGDKQLPQSGTPSRTGKAADSKTARQTVPSPLAQDSKNSLSKSSVSCPSSAKPSPGRKTKSSTPSHSLPHRGHLPPARQERLKRSVADSKGVGSPSQKAPLVPGVAVGTERITPSGRCHKSESTRSDLPACSRESQDTRGSCQKLGQKGTGIPAPTARLASQSAIPKPTSRAATLGGCKPLPSPSRGGPRVGAPPRMGSQSLHTAEQKGLSSRPSQLPAYVSRSRLLSQKSVRGHSNSTCRGLLLQCKQRGSISVVQRSKSLECVSLSQRSLVVLH
nr:PREDICTED: proline/serine-rich coiled-coil protein 1 isoform X3 [Lepisosteus oculatus]XP_015197955.1 PREDICTED: proline/serine-rich coiled-coil protein 1 isoform X3 [Lepisosteus oculatus]